MHRKMKKSRHNFRLSAFHLFLTYPFHEHLSKKVILEELKKKLQIQWIIISFEGESYKHFHILIKCKKRTNIKDPRSLDILGVHGNYKPAKNIKKAIIYICKENDVFAEGIDIQAFLDKNIEQVFDEINYLDTMREKLVFLFEKGITIPHIIKKGSLSLRSYVLDNLSKTQRLYSIFHTIINRRIEIPIDQIHKIPEEVLDWDRKKHTLILAGPTGIGKTTLAKALLPNGLLVRHLDKLKDLSALNEGFIIDDINLREKLSREETINLLDIENDTQVNIKHSFAEIPAYTPRIITTNHFTLDLLIPNDEYGAIKRRVKFIYYRKDS